MPRQPVEATVLTRPEPPLCDEHRERGVRREQIVCALGGRHRERERHGASPGEEEESPGIGRLAATRREGGGKSERPWQEIHGEVGEIIEERAAVTMLARAHESPQMIRQHEEAEALTALCPPEG